MGSRGVKTSLITTPIPYRTNLHFADVHVFTDEKIFMSLYIF